MTYKTWCARMAYRCARDGGSARDILGWLREWLTAPRGTSLDAPRVPDEPVQTTWDAAGEIDA